jgi:hypothetical protein
MARSDSVLLRLDPLFLAAVDTEGRIAAVEASMSRK